MVAKYTSGFWGLGVYTTMAANESFRLVADPVEKKQA